MNEQLPAFKIKQGRRVFDVYNILNAFSFALVTGNTVTLYALFLQANSTVVGLLMACMYLSFFAIPIGKLMIKRFSIIQIFAYAWILRHLSLLPILFIPVLYAKGYFQSALYCLLVSVVLFNFFRGVGMISNNPVIQILAPGKDRGSYIVRISLLGNIAALFANGMLAFLLWQRSSIGIYHLAAIIGIVFGLISSFLLFKIPEPAAKFGSSYNGRPADRFSFFTHVRDAFEDANFRCFAAAFFILSLGVSMARPFIIVYAKEVYGQNDGMITLLTLFSLVGALVVGFIMQLVIDRIGAKPMYSIFAVISAVSLIPALLLPLWVQGGYLAIIFLILLSVFSNMGFVGQDNTAQAYFFSMVPEEALMDLSMLYFFILGITGGLGSVAGGIILDFFRFSGLTALQSYQIFFAGIIAMISIGLFFQVKLLNLGSYKVSKTLAVLFSLRDMRALNLLHKLDTHKSLETEQKVLDELTEIRSSVSADQIAHYVRSPRLAIRLRALTGLYSLESISPALKDLVLEELEKGVFTTAPLAAKICGKFRITQAIPLLRDALESDDSYFTGEAMVALALLQDIQSLGRIGDILSATENTGLLLKGINALEIYEAESCVPLILALLRRETVSQAVSNEALLALAGLLGIQNDFYYSFERYNNENITPAGLLLEALDEAFSLRKKTDTVLKNTVIDFMESIQNDEAFVDWVMAFSNRKLKLHAALLMGVALEIDLIHRESFRFFLSFWAVCVFKNPKLLN